MGMEVQYDAISIGYYLNFSGYRRTKEDAWPGANDFLKWSERIFVTVFAIELLIRIIVFRLQFFIGNCTLSINLAYNWMDLLIVVAGLIDWIQPTMFDPKAMRLLRLTRVARIMRTFRNKHFLDSLHFLMTSISASFSTLFWSLCVLFVIQCVSGLTMCQILAHYFDGSAAADEKVEVFRYYGSFTRSLISMFEIVLGNYAPPCRVLADFVGEEFAFIVLFYRCICGLSVINVISAVFIQQTMKAMSQDTDIMLLERARSDTKFKKHLEKLFAIIDVSRDGVVSKEELHTQLDNPQVRLTCINLGIGVHDLEDIFNIFNTDEEGMIVEDFIEAAHSVRKQASTVDSARLLMHSRYLTKQVQAIHSETTKALKKLDSMQVSAQKQQDEQQKRHRKSSRVSTTNTNINLDDPVLPCLTMKSAFPSLASREPCLEEDLPRKESVAAI
jgi:hypothetical protein